MYRKLFLAAVLTIFTLGASVNAISLYDPTGEGRAAFERLAVHNRDIVEVSGPYDSWETAVKNIGRAKFIYNQNENCNNKLNITS